MESKGPLYLDSDGVFMDFTTGYYAYLKGEHGIEPIGAEPQLFTYGDTLPMMEKPYIHIPAFIDSDYFANVKPYPGAVEKIKALAELYDSVKVVTSCGTTPEIINNRLKSFGDELNAVFDDVVFLPLGACKQDVMRKMARGTFVDDQLKICEPVAELGHEVHLFHREYNKRECPQRMAEQGIGRIHCLSDVGKAPTIVLAQEVGSPTPSQPNHEDAPTVRMRR